MRRLLSALCLAATAGCGSLRHEAAQAPSPTLGRYTFTYAVTGRAPGLVQAFDDGAATYLQFNPQIPLSLALRADPEGPSLPFVRQGSYAVVAGLYPQT